MPELPEVQTIVSDLSKVLPGLKIRDIWSDLPRLWIYRRGEKKMIKAPKNFEEFRKKLLGKKILKLRRRGKNILIDLSGGATLLIHQKMTGHLLFGAWNLELGTWRTQIKGPLKDDPQNRFIHLVIGLSNGKQLALSDLRKFAKVLIWQTEKLGELDDLKKLGPDPLDKSFTFTKFKKILFLNFPAVAPRGNSRGKRKIKQFLMDQTKISGIGNIYSDEILWEAGIHPLKDIQNIYEVELRKIYKAIKKVLAKAIKAKGDSMSDYRRPSGEKGGYQKIQNAYQMTGKKCKKRDGGIIKRIKLGGRSAHFCSVHQKL